MSEDTASSPPGHTKVLNDTAVMVSWAALMPRALHSVELFLTLTANICGDAGRLWMRETDQNRGGQEQGLREPWVVDGQMDYRPAEAKGSQAQGWSS